MSPPTSTPAAPRWRSVQPWLSTAARLTLAGIWLAAVRDAQAGGS